MQNDRIIVCNNCEIKIISLPQVPDIELLKIPVVSSLIRALGASFVPIFDPIHDTELLNPLEVPGSSVFCLNELLGGAGHQKGQARIRGLEFSAPSPILQRGEKSWK